jgi:hypothetical protein
MSDIPTIVRGLLGWSNKRSGVEFYRFDPKIVPRHGSEWGDLLVEEDGIFGQEGSAVVVVVFPRSWYADQVEAVENAIREVLGA